MVLGAALAAAITAPAAARAHAAAQTELASLRATAAHAEELASLRSRIPDEVTKPQRPAGTLAERVAGALAEAGLPSSALHGVSPESQVGRGDSSGVVHRRATLTLAGTLPQIGRIPSSAPKPPSCKFVVTTDSNHEDPIAPNRLKRDFTAAAPDQNWVADLTYVPTAEGWAYVAVVLDLFSRRVVGWAVGDSLESSLVLDALDNALSTRRPRAGLIHHSDRGVRYASCSTVTACRARHRVQHEPSGRPERVQDIELFHNRERLHQALGYVTPVEFEANHRGCEAADCRIHRELVTTLWRGTARGSAGFGSREGFKVPQKQRKSVVWVRARTR